MQHQQAPETSALAHHGRSRPMSRSWLLARLDSLISEPLRRAPPAELARARVLAGSLGVTIVFITLFLVSVQLSAQPWTWSIPAGAAMMMALGTLAVLRRARSTATASMLACLTMSVGMVLSVIAYGDPFVATHATVVLAPAVAVYLMGPRQGLVIASVTIAGTWPTALLVHVSLSGGSARGGESLWLMCLGAAMAILFVWALGWLHSTARDEAQAALEQAMRKLQENEHKLTSLFENTGDMVCSFDLDGRLVIANAAMRQSYVKRFGKELVVGERLFAGVTTSNRHAWARKLGEALAGQRAHIEVEYELDGASHALEGSIGPIFGEDGKVVGVVLFGRDITARKQAEREMREMHRTLVDVSRQAGMAEIATGLFHNVGNALNSVHVSVSLLSDWLRTLRIPSLTRVVELLDAHAADLGAFITQDERGRHIPAYLRVLAEQLGKEQAALIAETRALEQSVDHIQSIIRTQQKHARTVEAVEEIRVPELIDEARRLHAVPYERLGIQIERDYAEVPSIVVDRHKLLQILVNLVSNAQHALMESDTPDKRMIIRIRLAPDGDQLCIEVTDNGVGIAPENIGRVFHQGFTTKKSGHGFGLHISALSATEMQGRLTCASPGLGQGATFMIELPLAGSPLPRP
jgi:PAS domain S-box-containing protein